MSTPTLLLDLITNARAEVNFQTTTMYRQFLVYDIDVMGLAGRELINALGTISGMPQIGTLAPGFNYTKCTDLRIISASGTAAKGEIVYQGPRNDTLLAYIAEQSASLIQVDRGYINTSGGPQAIQVMLDTQTTDQSGATINLTTVKSATVPAMLPCITVKLTANAVPYPLGLPKFGTVNSNTMGGTLFSDAPNPGYWLYCGRDISTSSNGVNYDLVFTLMSLVENDWSQYVYLKQSNGDNVVVTTSTFNALVSAGYSNSITQGMNGGKNVGVAKVGVYQTANMTAFSLTNIT